MNTTYTTDVEYNHWEKVGQVVSYSFTFRVNGTWNNTTIFATGLPNPKSATRFLGVNSSGNVPFRCMLSTTGTLSNAYSQTTPTNNQVVEGHITYITTD